MGTSLTGVNISSSYLGLLKSTDSLAISTSAKRITDGAGNDLPIKLSTNQMLFNAGTASAPALSFDGNLSEGFFLPTDENIGVAIAGSEVARFLSTGLSLTSSKLTLSNDQKVRWTSDDVYIQGTTSADNIQLGVGGSTQFTFAQTTGMRLHQYGSGNITGTVTQRLGVTSAGQVVEIPIGGGAVDGSGTAGKIVKWSDTDTITDSVISESSGNIQIQGLLGVGLVPDSAVQLSVNGQIGTSNNGNAGAPDFTFYGDDNTGMYRVGADSLGFTTGGTNALTFDSSQNATFAGNVLFSSDATISRNTSDASDNGYIALAGGGANSDGRGARIRLYGNEHASLAGVVDIATGNIAGSDMLLSATDTIQFYSGGSERMRLDSSGNVGIGDSTPNALLKLESTSTSESTAFFYSNASKSEPSVQIWQDGAGSSGAALLIRNDGSGNALQIDDGSAGNAVFTIGNTGNATFAGLVGIGGSPSEDLHITGDTPVIRLTDSDTSRDAQIVAVDGNLRFDADNNNQQSSTNISFRTDGTERARIDSNGRLGLGQTSMTYALEVINSTYDNIGWGGSSAVGVLTQQGSNPAFRTVGDLDIVFYANNNLQLTIDDGNAIFTGDAIFGGTSFEDNNSLARKIEIASANPVGLILNDTRDTHPMAITNDGAVMNLRYNTTAILSMDGASSASTFAGNVELKSDAGNATKHLRIWNEGTAANDDAVLTWQTQGSRHFSMGIHRDSGLLTISSLDASVSSSELMTMDLNGVANFTNNVGLGTTSPTSPTSVARFLEIQGTTAGIVLHDSDVEAWDLYASGGKLGTKYNNSVLGWWVDVNGNMGLGTGSPVNFTNQRSLTINGVTGGNARLDFQINETSEAEITANADDLTIAHNDVIKMFTSASERMRITSAGLLGVGLSSPQKNVHIKGAASAYTTLRIETGSDAHGAEIEFADSTDADYGSITQFGSGAGEGGRMRFRAGGTETMNLRGGKVGIGTSAPVAKLDVVDGTNNNEGADATDFRFVASNRAITTERANMEIYTNDSQAADLGASIGFGGRHTDSSTNDSLFATIKAGKENATSANYAGYLSFGTSKSDSDIVERMRITSGGNVGIGIDTPTLVAGNIVHIHGTAAGVHLTDTASGTANTDGGYVAFDNPNLYIQNKEAGFMSFETSATERMRIDSSGNLLIAKTSLSISTVGYELRANGQALFTCDGDGALNVNRLTSDGDVAFFRKADNVVGSISVTSSATAYNTSSDYRLKEDLQDFNALDIASKIKMYDFKWKADDTRSYGVMAHELQEVVPQAVSGDKDAEEMQQVDYSKLVPILLKSIQELEARVKELEKEI